MNESQGSGLLDLFKNMTDEEKQALQRMGQTAAGLAQPMNEQVAPMQFGGGLLQMMPVPEMQYGVGMMGYQPSDNDGDKMENLMKIMKALGMGA